MADIEVPKNLYLETDCDHKDDSNQEPPLPTSLVVRRECPQEGGVENVDVAPQQFEMNLPRRLAKREAIHMQ